MTSIQIDIDALRCEYENIHTYADNLCMYCGWSKIPYGEYNRFDGWFPYPAKHSDFIYWSNYRCKGQQRYADTYRDYPEIWRMFRKLPSKYSKYIYYAYDNLMEIPYTLGTVEVYVYKRCNECRSCIMYSSRKMIARLMEKANKMRLKAVYLWTFGTNKLDTIENRAVLRVAWQKTCTYLSNWYKRPKNQGKYSYRPIFKVIETGKAGYLHIHAIFTTPIDYFLVRKTWSRYIKIKNPNVNYSEKEFVDPIKAFSYVAKYCSKAIGKSRNWSFMGKFYGNK